MKPRKIRSFPRSRRRMGSFEVKTVPWWKRWLYRKRHYNIQAAIDALPDNPGGLVYIDHGDYTPGSSLTVEDKPVDLIGAGYSARIINDNLGDFVVKFNATTGWDDLIQPKIKNLRIEGTDNTSDCGVLFDGGSLRATVRDVYLDGFDVGVRFDNSVEWHESWDLRNLDIRDVLTGIEFKQAGAIGDSTASFICGYLADVDISLDRENAVGVKVPSNAKITQSQFNKMHIWFSGDRDVQTGMELKGNVNQVTMTDIYSEETVGVITPTTRYGYDYDPAVGGVTFINSLGYGGTFTELMHNPNDKWWMEIRNGQLWRHSASYDDPDLPMITNLKDAAYQGWDLTGAAKRVIHPVADGRTSSVWAIYQKTSPSWTLVLDITGDGGMSIGGDVDVNDNQLINLDYLNAMNAKSSAPGSPVAGDVYLDDGTNTGDSNPHFRYYDGAAWHDL